MPFPRFIDTHSQVYYDAFDDDRAAVLSRAKAAGVDVLIEVGNDLQGSADALAHAHAAEAVFAMAGVHPHHAAEYGDAALEAFAPFYTDPKVVAVGEIGLDFYRDLSPRDEQERVFKRFLRYGKEVGKPLVIHCRDAWQALFRILEAEGRAPYNGVLHCFTGTPDEVRACLDLGLSIAFAGPVTYKQNKALREACRLCPPERILLETDCPYLPPQSKRGKRNEPAFLCEVAEVVAQIHGLSVDVVAVQTTRNAIGVFGLPYELDKSS